jgi:hypothetical protein
VGGSNLEGFVINSTILIKLKFPGLPPWGNILYRRISNDECRSMESLRSMIDFLPQRTQGDAKLVIEKKIEKLYLSLRFLACHVKCLVYFISPGRPLR